MIYSDEENANYSNNYSASILTVDDFKTELPEFVEKSQTKLTNVRVSVQDIKDIISTIQPNKAVGHDSISQKLLKATNITISKPLSMLFNKSLEFEIFPF